MKKLSILVLLLLIQMIASMTAFADAEPQNNAELNLNEPTPEESAVMDYSLNPYYAEDTAAATEFMQTEPDYGINLYGNGMEENQINQMNNMNSMMLENVVTQSEPDYSLNQYYTEFTTEGSGTDFNYAGNSQYDLFDNTQNNMTDYNAYYRNLNDPMYNGLMNQQISENFIPMASMDGNIAGTGVMPDMTENNAIIVRPVTRSEGVREILSIIGSVIIPAESVNADMSSIFFNDISSEDDDYIISAHRIGLVNGYVEGDFRPDDILTREDFATLAWRAFNIIKKQNYILHYSVDELNELQDYIDNHSISSYANPAFRIMIANEILNPVEKNLLNPKAAATTADLMMLKSFVINNIYYKLLK